MMNFGATRRDYGRLLARAVIVAAGVGILAGGVRADEREQAPAASQPAGGPGDLMNNAVNSDTQVFVDDSFKAQEKIRDAERFLKQGQTDQAIKAYQQITEEFGQKLIAETKDTYVSFVDFARGKLLAIPAVQKGAYDQLFGLQASKAFADAIAAHDTAAVRMAADRYFPATATVKGLATAADWAFENGDFATAAADWELLLTHPGANDEQATLLHHAALASKLAGRDVAAKELRDRLAKDFSDATGTVGGQQVTLLANLDAALAQPGWSSQTLAVDEWPMFQGSPDRSQLTDVRSSAGANLWRIPLHGDQSATPAANVAGGAAIINGGFNVRVRMINGVVLQNGMQVDPNSAEGAGALASSYPVISQGQLFIHSGDAVTCLSAAGSNVLWTYPGADAGAAQNAMWAASRAGGAHDSVAVLDDVVYAVLPASGRGAAVNAMPGFAGGGIVAANRVAALSREGKELWSKATTDMVNDLKEQFPKLDGGVLMLVGSPLVTRGGVYVIATKAGTDTFIQMFLIKLDAQTGKPRFATYLCSASQANMYYGGQMPGLPLAVPTFADDTVYITTGQGADCAVSASLGRLLWLNVTEAGHNAAVANGQPFNPGMGGGQSFTDARSWKVNPPLVYQDKLITRERNAPVRIYNRFSGKLLTELKPGDFGEPRITLGVVNGNLVTLGKELCVTNLETLQPAFASISLTDRHEGKIAGRPFLAQNLIYLPFEKGLMTVSTADGKISNFSDWPAIPSDKPGEPSGERQGLPGNLLVTSEQIIVASSIDVAGYSKWETALANRQKAISAAADSPKPYLDLAEIAFRTAHFDLAEQNMTKAVDLAVAQINAGASAAVPADPALVAHLYHSNLSFAEQLVGKSEPELRDRSRYYYNAARQVAKSPETQAQWRLCLAVLANLQNKPEEAAQLNSDVLTDPALRNAPFKRGDNTTRAGSTAEANLRKLIKDLGRDRIYKPFEAQAGALLTRGRAAQDSAVIDNVIFGYPNSLTAIAAASELSDSYRDKHQYVDQLRVMTWLSPRVSKPEDRVRITADFALANLGLRRYGAALAWAERGVRQFHNVAFTQNGQQTTFSSLAISVTQAMPATTQGRRAVLTSAKNLNFDPASVKPEQELAQGYLLTPIEASASLRRPDGVFVYERGKVSYFAASDFAAHAAPKWTAELKESKQAALLGIYANTAVIATPGFVHGIDVETGAVKYALTWAMPADNQQRVADGVQQLRAAAMLNRRMVLNGGFVNGGMMIINGRAIPRQAIAQDDDGAGGNGGVPFGLDADTARGAQLQAALAGSDRPIFTSLSILGSRLVAVVGNEVRAFDVGSGKPCWDKNPVLPDGATGVVVGNDELIVAQVDAPDRLASTLISIDAATGQWHAKIQLADEHVSWRALSDDGVLYTISDQAVAAWDLHGDVTQPAWKKPSFAQLRYAFASQLTLDGLMLITNNADLTCIPLDGDDSRVWSERLRLPLSNGQLAALRTYPDGQDMILQTSDNVICYRMSDDLSNVAEAGSRMVWQAAFDNPGDLPPLVGLQLGERHAALLAAGPTKSVQRAVQLVVLDLVNPQDGTRSNGSQVYDENITQWGDNSGQGPVIRRWQMVDKGIAFEIGGNVYVLRAKQ